MEFIHSFCSHPGAVKEKNQDSLLIERGRIGETSFYLYVVCDGMGGLDKGEVASAELIRAFSEWFREELTQIWQEKPYQYRDGAIEVSLKQLLERENRKIAAYGRARGIHMGSTVSAFLSAGDYYYIVHIGDSRIYEIGGGFSQLTDDHTLVAREVQEGRLGPREAETDSRRNVLLQCVGASEVIEPQFRMGSVGTDTVYLLCSDGFRHTLTEEEIFQCFQPGRITTAQQIGDICRELTQLAMDRGEEDNITVLAARSYREG
ncbi:PP2C family protein-serine/threonine phosphatase [Candidatus Acetatifactor stercoripullorum]|uniref:PP2C family protein-serine/threonine phosphatase n=1 Tax=Candidatus Acetatifactor stercoripullorum TaxID=2838414 RepID=UPI00298E54EC|nr:protein phosphatase 2C domain-containing protein [Candidatus Acetatifactor stercoripullorum]